MAFRGQNNRNRNFGGGNYGNMNRGGGMNPWDNQGNGGNYGGGGGMRQGGGGGGGGGGQGMNAEALNLANNLLNNLLRNPNQNPPSLLALNRGMGGNRNRQMGNRLGGGGGVGGNGRNRRPGGSNRGPKAGNKQTSGGVRKQVALDRAKKILAKSSNKKKDSDENSKQERKSAYVEVPNDMFYCHLCKKHMWDAVSFENHIKGRTHLMMREGIEESYRLKANMIRQEAKIAETLKSIEVERLKRMGKKQGKNHVEYCTMCDLQFLGHLSLHRKSEGHLQLKKFLHPKCGECVKEFHTRIEFDTHLLSADHLKRAAEKNLKPGDRQLLHDLPINTEEDESRDVRPPQKRKKKVVKVEEEKKEGEEGAEEKKEGEEGATEDEIKKENGGEGEGGDETAENEADETKEGDQTMEEGKDEDEYEEVPLPVDPEGVILEFDENDEVPQEVDEKIPKYNFTRAVGGNLIKRLECVECRLCGKYFDNETTAEVHTRTVAHHRQFVKFINEKSSDTKIAQKRATAAAEEVERKKKKLEEAEKAATAEGEAAAGEGEEQTGDLYDPSEATADDEDVEMAGNGEENGGEEAATEDAAMETAEAAEPVKEEAPAAAAVVEPVVEEEKPVVAEPVVETPTPVAAATPAKKAAASTTKAAATPAAAATPTTTPRQTPQRNRGRGRYNRY